MGLLSSDVAAADIHPFTQQQLAAAVAVVGTAAAAAAVAAAAAAAVGGVLSVACLDMLMLC